MTAGLSDEIIDVLHAGIASGGDVSLRPPADFADGDRDVRSSVSA
jgi:hypothetical protein